MIIYKDYKTFFIMGKEVNIFFDSEADHPMAVAEIDEQIYYVDGGETNSITAAIFAWQEVKGCELNSEELHQILIDNKLICNPLPI